MKNIMEAVELEMKVKELDKEITKRLLETYVKTVFIDIKYAGDKLRDMEMIKELEDVMAVLLKLVNKLKDIEMRAIKINDMTIYFKCENRIAKLVNAMEYIRNKYMY